MMIRLLPTKMMRSPSVGRRPVKFVALLLLASASTQVAAFTTPSPSAHSCLSVHSSPPAFRTLNMSTDSTSSPDEGEPNPKPKHDKNIRVLEKGCYHFLGDTIKIFYPLLSDLAYRNKSARVSTFLCDRQGKPGFFFAGEDFRPIAHDPKKIIEVEVSPAHDPSDADKVFVYCTEEGSGKTTDLVSSAYIRKGALTLLLDIKDDICAFHESNMDKCMEEARAALKSQIVALVVDHFPVLEKTIDFIHSMDISPVAWSESMKANPSKKEPIKIILAVDDANDLPNFIKTTIHNNSALGKEMSDFLRGYCDGEEELQPMEKYELKVLFGFAGTELAWTMDGDLSENCVQIIPSMKRNPGDAQRAQAFTRERLEGY